MKKLLVALILGVILTATLATPAFAGDGNGNMPGKAGDTLWDHVRGHPVNPPPSNWPLDGALFNGCFTTARHAMALGVANVASRAIYWIAKGFTPPWTGP